MALKGLTGGVYQPLSSADIETIHQTSLTILENTGISYESGLEETIDMLATMGGSNFIHHAAGMLESMLAVAYEQYVIDDEIIGMCCKVLKGIEVDAEHLALETIDYVGPGGNFIASDHTFAHMRTENLPETVSRTERFAMIASRMAREIPPHVHERLPEQF